MQDLEAVRIINKIRGCRYTANCSMNCQNCPSNYSDEELHEALKIANDCINERINRAEEERRAAVDRVWQIVNEKQDYVDSLYFSSSGQGGTILLESGGIKVLINHTFRYLEIAGLDESTQILIRKYFETLKGIPLPYEDTDLNREETKY